MIYFYRFLFLVLFALLGGIAYALTVNVLIGANMFSNEQIEANFGYKMTQKAVYVWVSTTIAGILSVFFENKLRYVLLALPFIAPSAFALIYSLSS